MNKYKFENKQGGFLKTIIIIVVVLFILSYFFHISPRSVLDWIINLIHSIF